MRTGYLMTALLLATATPAAGQSGELRLHPQGPPAGASVEVTYQPSVELSDQREVRLRGRVRATDTYALGEHADHVTLGTLRRDGAVFRGSFQLPDSLVYVRLAVETLDGDVIDLGSERPFELLVHESGTPTVAALRQQMRDRNADAQRFHEAAVEATRWHPESVELLRLRFIAERSPLGAEAAAPLMAEYAQKFTAIAEALRGTDPGPDQASELAEALAIVGDTETAEHWGSWLEERHPEHSGTINRRRARAFSQHRSDPAALARALEEVAAAGMTPPLAMQGFNAAEAAGAVAALQRWAARWVQHQPRAAANLAARMLMFDDLRPEAVTVLTAEIRREADDSTRPLHHTRREHEQRHQATRSRHAVSLAAALSADGDTAGALRVLQQAAAWAWTPALLRDLARTAHALGEHEQAVQAAAALAADPLSSLALRDSLAQTYGPLSGGTWRDVVAGGREEWKRQVMAGGTSLTLNDRVRVHDQDGEAVPLTSLVKPGSITLLAIWYRNCQISRFQLPVLAQLADRLDGERFSTLSLTPEAPSDDINDFVAQQQVGLPVLYDPGRIAMGYLLAPGTPTYFVIDGAGVVRLRSHDLTETERFLKALAPQSDNKETDS